MTAAAAETRAAELFALVGLDRRALRAYPHQLSGGMRQRVVIAIALALAPKVIVMDEPTTALDVAVQKQILTNVERLRRDLGIAIVFISHDLPLLLSFADRVAIMQHGKLVEVGTPVELRTRPRHPYTRALLAAFPPPLRPRHVPPPALPRLLAVRGLGKRFGRAPVLDGVSFDLHEGEVVALVGASGSGKSTLARILAGLDKPDGGMFEARGVQLVFQDPFASLNPARRIRHAIARPLALHGGATDERIDALLSSVGLDPALAARFPHELSGGQRQRVAIARALAAAPRLLVADEPTSMLDASLRRDLLALLRAMAKDRGLGVLLITHDLAGAAQVADRTLTLDHGRIVAPEPDLHEAIL
jgi:peptide/nickel transport system ATP-binding protein